MILTPSDIQQIRKALKPDFDALEAKIINTLTISLTKALQTEINKMYLFFDRTINNQTENIKLSYATKETFDQHEYRIGELEDKVGKLEKRTTKS